jgi:hypothetical protein
MRIFSWNNADCFLYQVAEYFTKLFKATASKKALFLISLRGAMQSLAKSFLSRASSSSLPDSYSEISARIPADMALYDPYTCKPMGWDAGK